MSDREVNSSNQRKVLVVNATPKPYAEVTDDDFATVAAENFSIRETSGGVILVGACPRCGDPMEFPWVDDTYRGVTETATVTAPVSRRIVTMLCTCTAPHEGRPGDSFGCGAFWNLAIED
jgi:hypothetical protein